MIRNNIKRLWLAYSLPSTLAHEVTHAALAYPFADELALVIKPRPAVVANWGDAPRAAVKASHYGPFVGGVVMAIAAVVWMFTGGRPPSTTNEWLTLVALVGAWYIYMHPNEYDRDLDVADGGGESTTS
jgi:hypothetical protein